MEVFSIFEFKKDINILFPKLFVQSIILAKEATSLLLLFKRISNLFFDR